MLAETQQPLVDESTEWISHMRTYINNINELKNKLYQWAANKSDHDELVQIERYHNQFHIQLINLHDLKHSIKLQMKEFTLNPGADYAEKHHQLEEQYIFLIKTLDDLKTDFKAFVSD